MPEAIVLQRFLVCIFFPHTRNIFAEWHARDTSRKIRAIFGARTAAGKHVTGALPYGYLHDPDDRQKWILDEEAAPVVRRIFQGVIEGKTLAQIGEELTAERILTPAAHWRAIGERVSMGASGADPYKWATATLSCNRPHHPRHSDSSASRIHPHK